MRTVGVVGLGALGSRIARRLLDSGLDADESAPRFTLSLARKDAALIGDAETAAGLDLRVLAAAETWFDDAASEGLDGLDYSAVLRQIVGPPRG